MAFLARTYRDGRSVRVALLVAAATFLLASTLSGTGNAATPTVAERALAQLRAALHESRDAAKDHRYDDSRRCNRVDAGRGASSARSGKKKPGRGAGCDASVPSGAVAEALGEPAPPTSSFVHLRVPADLGGEFRIATPLGGDVSWRLVDAPAASRQSHEFGAWYDAGGIGVAVTATVGSFKEQVVVHERQGRRTWAWDLAWDGDGEPHLTKQGEIEFPNGVSFDAPFLTNLGGARLDRGLRWSLEGNRLSVTFDDRSLPLPYVLDPSGDYPARLYLGSDGSSNVTGAGQLCTGSCGWDVNSTREVLMPLGEVAFWSGMDEVANPEVPAGPLAGGPPRGVVPGDAGWIHEAVGATTLPAGPWTASASLCRVGGGFFEWGQAMLAARVLKVKTSGGQVSEWEDLTGWGYSAPVVFHPVLPCPNPQVILPVTGDRSLAADERIYIELGLNIVDDYAGALVRLQIDGAGTYLDFGAGGNTNILPPATTLSITPTPSAPSWIINDNTPTFSADLTDVDSFQHAQFQVCRDAACSDVYGTFSSPSGEPLGGSNNSVTPPAIPDGTYYVRARIVEDSGQSGTGPWTPVQQMSIDAVGPEILGVSWVPTAPNPQYSAAGSTPDFLWYQFAPPAPARVQLEVLVQDVGTIDHVSFPDLPSYTIGWSIPSGSNIVTVGTPTGVPGRFIYTLVYEFNGMASDPDEALIEIMAEDSNGLQSFTTATIEPDPVDPAGAYISYPSGIRNAAQPITWSPMSDLVEAESGPKWVRLHRYQADYVDGACVGWTGPLGMGTMDPSARPNPYTPAVLDATCYRYGLDISDRVANEDSITSSDVLMIDMLPPGGTNVNDGPGPGDIDSYGVGGALTAHWDPISDPSGIAEYELCFTQNATGANCHAPGATAPWQSVGTDTDGTRGGLSLVDGNTYYACVRARDGAGSLGAVSCSDGVVADLAGPTISWNRWDESSVWLHAVGTTPLLWYNPAAPAGTAAEPVVHAVDSVGMQGVAYPDLTASGWNPPGGGSIAAYPPADLYRFTSYQFAGASAPILAQATATDTSLATATVDFQMLPDPTGPDTPTLTVPNAGGYHGSSTISLDWDAGTDAASGLLGGQLRMRSAGMAAGACLGFGVWGDLGPFDPSDPYVHGPLADGQCYEYELRARDNVNNETVVGALPIMVDLGDPAVAITGPAVGPISGNVNVTGVSSDTASGISHVDVAFTGPSSGDVCLAPASPTNFSCPWDTTLLADGTYTITVTAYDNAGRSHVDTRIVTIDNTDPLVTWTSWSEASSFAHAIGSTLYFNPAAPGAFDADATVHADDGAGTGIDYVEFPDLGGSGWLPGAVQVPAPQPGDLYTRTYTSIVGMSVGTSDAAAGYDNAGRSASAGFDVVEDADDPINGTLSTANAGSWIGGNSETVSFDPGDDGAGSGIRDWQVFHRIAPIVAGACGGYGLWQPASPMNPGSPFVHGPLPDASCVEYQLVVNDNVSNQATIAGPAAVMIDQVAPTGTITGPSGLISGLQNVTGTSSDAASGVDRVEIRYSGPANGAICLGPPSPTNFSCPWDTTLVPEGDYDIELVVWDIAGNQSVTIVETVTVENTAPTINLDSFDDGGSPYAHWNGFSSFAWFNPSPPVPQNVDVLMYAFDGGTGVQQVDYPGAAAANWLPAGAGSVPFALREPGDLYRYTYTFGNPATPAGDFPASDATATDNAGNAAVATFDFQPDSTAPAGVDITMTGPSLIQFGNIANTLDAGIELESGFRDYDIEYQILGAGSYEDDTCGAFPDPSDPTTWNSLGPWNGMAFSASITLGSGFAGCIRFRLVQWDNVANRGESAPSAIVRFDDLNPTVSIDAPADGTPHSGTVPVQGSAIDPDSGVDRVRLTYTGPAVGTICDPTDVFVQDTATDWSWSCDWNTSLLPDGLYTITARSFDLAGNQSAVDTIQVLLDNNPPVASFLGWDESSAWAHSAGGNLLWMNPAAPIAIPVDALVQASDGGSGMDRVDYPDLAPAGWNPPGGGFDDAPEGAGSDVYRFSYTGQVGSAGAATDAARAWDNAGTGTNVPFEIREDATAPSGGVVTSANEGSWQSGSTEQVNFAPGADLESGIREWQLQRSEATIVAGTCGGFGGWGDVGALNETSPFVDSGLADGMCYQYQLVVTDNVSNVDTVLQVDPVMIDQTPPTAAITAPSGPISGAVNVTGTSSDGESGISHVEVRYTGPEAGDICLSPASPTNFSCPWNTAALLDGTYTIELVAWDIAGNQSVLATSTVDVDNFPPTVAFSAWNEASAWAHPGAGSLLWVNPGATTAFNAELMVTATDGGSGVDRVDFPDLTASGFDPPGGGFDDTPDVGDIFRFTYAAQVGAIAAATDDVTATDHAGTQATAGFEIAEDSAPPAAGTVNHANAGAYHGSQDILVSFDPGGDAQSGIRDWQLQTRSAPLAGGLCGAFDPTWTDIGALSEPSPYNHTGMADGFCHEFRLLVRDNVNNEGVVTGPAPVMLDLTPPVASITLAEGTNPQFQYLVSPTEIIVNPDEAGDFTATVIANAPSGIADVTFPPLGANWTGDAILNVPPYVTTYAWTATAGNPGAPQSIARSNTNATTNLPFTVTLDGSGPSGGTIDYPNGYQSVLTATVNFTEGTDMGSGVAAWQLERDVATLSNGVCVGWSGFLAEGPAGGATYVDNGLVDDACHRYRLAVSDNVGNTSYVTSPDIVRVDTTPPTSVDVTIAESSQYAWADTGSNTVWYNSNQTDSFVATVTGVDAASGIGSGEFTGMAAGWTPTANVVDATSPFQATYTWDLGAAAAPGTLAGGAVNRAGLVTWENWTVVDDPVPPDNSGFIQYAGGIDTDTSIGPITFGDGLGDADSGLERRFLERRETVAVGLTCPGPWGPWGQVGGDDPASPYTDNAVAQPTCYEYRYVEVDRVGNRTEYTDPEGDVVIELVDVFPPTAFDVVDPPPGPALPAISTGGGDPPCVGVPTYDTMPPATPDFQWNPSTDADSGLAGYDLYIDGTAAPDATLGAGATTWPVPALSDGGHQWGVTAFDALDNRRDSGPTYLRNIRIDSAAPNAALVTPADGSFTTDTTPAFDWTASDSNCLARVEVWIDGIREAVASGSEGAWTPATPLTEGNHTWNIVAIDSLGRTTASASANFAIDLTPPSGITAIFPPDGGTENEGMLTFDWSDGTDALGSVTHYDLRVDGTWIAFNLNTSQRANIPIYPGNHTWTVRAYDEAGNFDDFTFTFDAVDVPDVTPPDPFDLLAPSDGSVVSTGDSLSWEAAWDFEGIDHYDIYIDNVRTATVPGGTTSWMLTGGLGALQCVNNFDPTINSAGCLDSAAYAPPWTLGANGGNNLDGTSVGITNWDAAAGTTAFTYRVVVPASGASLTFDHSYDNHANYNGAGEMHSAFDGGTVEISEDGGATWDSTCIEDAWSKYGSSIPCDFDIVDIDGGYTAVLAAGTGSSGPYRNVFGGQSAGFVQSTVHLSEFAGQTIHIRFRQLNDLCHMGLTPQQQSKCPPNLQASSWYVDNLSMRDPALSLGLHDWYVRAVDPSGNETQSNQTWTFDLQ